MQTSLFTPPTSAEINAMDKVQLNELIEKIETYNKSILNNETVEYAYKLRVNELVGALCGLYYDKFVA